MALYVGTDSEALIAQNNLSSTEYALSSAMTDLSSGLRINTAADDAAGYVIANDLTAQIGGLNQASSNAQNGVSLIQTAAGAINDVQQMLQRVRELAVEYNGGTLDATDKNAITSEISQLTGQIQQIGLQVQFNGITLFGGGGSNPVSSALAAEQSAYSQFESDYATYYAEVGTNPQAVSNATATGAADPGGALYTAAQTLSAKVAALDAAAGVTDAGIGSTAQAAVSDISTAAYWAPGGWSAVTSTSFEASDLASATTANQAVVTYQSALVGAVTALSPATTITFQVGANAGESIGVTISSLNPIVSGLQGLTANNGQQLSEANNATLLSTISSYIDQVSSIGAQLGAIQNRLGYTLDNLSTYSENLSSARSTIKGTDMASAMTKFTKDQILQQTGISVLSQAEQNPQIVLKLLGA